MQACQNIFVAQCNANANARKQSCQHKRMARVLHNQRRTKNQHTGAGDTRQEANQ
ncbi:hypothetical protein HmCmsJML003_01193 [Escherichia coli]|nr:hypothetical protein HmCmsJML003_01193 [Escherichia coli]GDU83347.1 hypothetical protein BvCmsSIP076_04703 [Escherichia coli]